MHEPWERVQWMGLVYGNPGTRKTFFAAGMPKPMKVLCFDPPAKALAYLQQGVAGPVTVMEDGGRYQFVWTDEESAQKADPGQGLVVEIEYFVDTVPAMLGRQKHLSAYERFQDALAAHTNEGWAGYRSVVLDSYTFCELAAIRLEQYKLNPGAKDPRQWYAGAKGHIQRDILSTFVWAGCHGCVIAHVDPARVDLQDKQKWGVSATGTLRGDLPGAFPEVYLMYEERGEDGKLRSMFLTESDGMYIAQTHIGAPNPCEPRWEALWAAYR